MTIKATDICSEYLIVIDFPWQKWLYQHITVLHYMYTACLVKHYFQSTSHTDPLVAYARGYEDYLQCPLQPLMDNLESQTYEVFEKDPVKYNEYQRAIYVALLDRVSYEQKDTKTV